MTTPDNQISSISEFAVTQCPTEEHWSENYLFALHDERSGIGMWLHLGSMPSDWDIWEDRVYMVLPGGKKLSMVSYHAPAKQLLPAGAVMRFQCVTPYKKWVIDFDGYALETSEEAMASHGEPRFRRRLKINLEVECLSPVWDARSGTGSRGRQGLSDQSWAKEHYEQLISAVGRVNVDGHETVISAKGWRDHSRGPRGRKSADAWGGHVIAGAVFPSGRMFLVSRYWRPDGLVSLEGGMYTDEKGRSNELKVIEAPALTELKLRDESVPFHLLWSTGEMKAVMRTQSSIWVPRERKHLVANDDFGRLKDMYVINWGVIQWQGEAGNIYLERSAHLNALPSSIRLEESLP